MKNNSLIIYTENIFTKISNFFKKLFFRNKKNIIEKNIETPTPHSPSKSNFIQNIKIEENKEVKRLKELQLKYDNGEILEEDISDEDITKLIEMYDIEAEELNADTERRKIHIAQMLKDLKQS